MGMGTKGTLDTKSSKYIVLLLLSKAHESILLLHTYPLLIFEIGFRDVSHNVVHKDIQVELLIKTKTP